MEMDGRNEQTEIEDHTLVEIEEQATQHVVTAMKGKLQSVSGRQKTMDGRNEQTKMSEVNIPISSSHGITRSLKSPMDVESEIEDKSSIVDIITDMKDKLREVSFISKHRCIYRVPKHLRDTNEAAYVPRLVSLGPFHHGNENLKAMEEHKLRCFKSFIEDNHINMAALFRLMKDREEETREYYADHIALPSKRFVQVILVDAIFVINFLLELHSSALAIHVGSIYHEDFFRCEVSRDMMLLENQLPLFILDEILHFAIRTAGTSITELHSVTQLSICLFNCHKIDMIDHKSKMIDPNRYNNERHFVDLQTLLFMPQEARCNGKFERIKSISKLHKAGVRFKLASAKTLLDINFEDGVLEIPGIVVSGWTETIFRNLLAYDQCHHGSLYISDYFVLMGMLIDTADDVELLVKNKILQNDLATEQEVSKVFNNLEKEVIDKESFYYSKRCNQINKYCEKPWHKWMATLKQNYLDTPWKVISLIAAFILLVLTMIQTVYSVISP